MFRAVNYLESAYKVFFMEREYEIFALRILKKKAYTFGSFKIKCSNSISSFTTQVLESLSLCCFSFLLSYSASLLFIPLSLLLCFFPFSLPGITAKALKMLQNQPLLRKSHYLPKWLTSRYWLLRRDHQVIGPHPSLFGGCWTSWASLIQSHCSSLSRDSVYLENFIIQGPTRACF